MKNIILFVIAIICINTAYSQDSTASKVKLKNHKFSVNLLLYPSINYELKLAEKQSLKLGVGISAIIDENGDALGVASFFSTSYRRYYSNKNPKLSYNSGSYYGIKSKLILDAEDVNGNIFTPDKAAQIIAIWGFQNNYKNNLYFGVNLGPGISLNPDFEGKFTALIDVQFGFNL